MELYEFSRQANTIDQSRKVVTLLSKLALSAEELHVIRHAPVNAVFNTSYLTICQLHCLLNESWLCDTVIDARISYLVTLSPKGFLWPDSLFHITLDKSFHEQRHSRLAIKLRKMISEPDGADFFAFHVNKNNSHWTAVLIRLATGEVFISDSMSKSSEYTLHPTDPVRNELLPKLKFFLGDIERVQRRLRVTRCPTPQQPSGSGSCGIISTMAIWAQAQRLMGISSNEIETWSHAKSQDFRRNWAQQLLRTNLGVSRFQCLLLYFQAESLVLWLEVGLLAFQWTKKCVKFPYRDWQDKLGTKLPCLVLSVLLTCCTLSPSRVT